MPLTTPRLLLFPATAPLLRAELAGRDRFAEVLGMTVPASWPPDLYDEDAIRYSIARLEELPDPEGWGGYYIARKAEGAEPAVVIGVGGFKGRPDEAGVVELGYAIVAEHRRRGYATEAVRGMVAFAFGVPAVTKVIAHTLPSLVASIGVLEKAGFQYAGPGEDPGAPPGEPVIRYQLARVTTGANHG